jgi:hypothetical protein
LAGAPNNQVVMSRQASRAQCPAERPHHGRDDPGGKSGWRPVARKRDADASGKAESDPGPTALVTLAAIRRPARQPKQVFAGRTAPLLLQDLAYRRRRTAVARLRDLQRAAVILAGVNALLTLLSAAEMRLAIWRHGLRRYGRYCRRRGLLPHKPSLGSAMYNSRGLWYSHAASGR